MEELGVLSDIKVLFVIRESDPVLSLAGSIEEAEKPGRVAGGGGKDGVDVRRS